jgi:hypothetical protein
MSLSTINLMRNKPGLFKLLPCYLLNLSITDTNRASNLHFQVAH